MIKNPSAAILTAAILASAACTNENPAPRQIRLDEGWTLRSETTGKTYKASVPSTVAGTLYDAGVIAPDILERDNYPSLDKSVLDGEWTYRKVLHTGKPAPGEHYSLRLGGVGYRADISLNGRLISAADTTLGVFASREYDITSLLRRRNVLEIKVSRAGSGDLNVGFVDWNPLPADGSMGLVREVSLLKSGPVAIRDLYVRPSLSEDLSAADLEIRCTLLNKSAEDRTIQLCGDTEGIHFEMPLTIGGGQNREIRLTPEDLPQLHIDNPRVWWSRDLGEPELYSLKMDVSSDGLVSDRDTATFGIRRLESGLDEMGHRYYRLNGVKLLITGAGWTDDIFLRDTHESLEQQVKMVADMHLNCIRFEGIWGKDDYIYDLCDRYGILALVGWSCQWEWEQYCGIPHDRYFGCITTPQTKALVLRYFESQLKRLRNHPSIIAWLTASDRKATADLEKEYFRLRDELDPDKTLVCAASGLAGELAGPSGNKMTGPYEYVGPEYWYLDKRLGGAFGFNTETSIGMNIPQQESLERMLGKEAWPINGIWDAHCTVAAEAMHSTDVMQEVIAGQYGPAGTMEEFVRRAHSVDFEGTRAMFEAFRARRGESTGVIQWMLNSAWPSLYWQLYDWYGVPTAGYYGVKKALSPLQVIWDYGQKRLFAVNGTRQERQARIRIKVYGADSALLSDESFDAAIPALGTTDALPCSLEGLGDVFVFCRIGSGDLSADNFYAVPERGNEHLWDKSNWYITPIGKYADMRFVRGLGNPQIEVLTEENGQGGYTVTLHNPSDTIAWQVILKLTAPDGTLVTPALWSDNFLALEPHSTKTVTCLSDTAGATVSCSCGL